MKKADSPLAGAAVREVLSRDVLFGSSVPGKAIWLVQVQVR